LPATAQADVAKAAFLDRNDARAAAIGHVVPEESAGALLVDRLHQIEAGFVANLAVDIGAELDVGDDAIVRIGRVEFTEGPAPDLLVRERLAGERCDTVDHDARDSGLGWGARDDRSGAYGDEEPRRDEIEAVEVDHDERDLAIARACSAIQV
jgi:hypothetical protein